MICDKIAYKTHKEAIAAIIPITRKSKHKYSAYKCKDCSLFHITTINKKTLFPSNNDKYPLKIEDIKPKKFEIKVNPLKRKKEQFKPATEKLLSKELVDKLKSKFEDNENSI